MKLDNDGIYIVSACRTPIGKMGGVFRSVKAVDLAVVVMKEAISRAGIDEAVINHVYMGCVIQAGLGQNVARQASLAAGIPVTTTAETLNMVCGSGLDAVNSAARLIRCKEADVVLAGGMESMSKAPFAIMEGRYGYRMGNPMVESSLVDTMIKDALWDSVNDCHMGITAENIAEQYGLNRRELDIFAAESQKKASMAQESIFSEEIVPVVIHGKKEDIIVEKDEGPRRETTVENLSKLQPVFKENGIVTAGNSSGINDGAAAVILASGKRVKELGVPVIAEWCGGALGGVDPKIMGLGPVASTRNLLNRLNMTIDDIDLFEVNEAFAAQALAVQRELRIPDDKMNVYGGAIALGHPVGASGCRILVTLLHEMKRRKGAVGLATLCIGGGMGCSTVVKMD